MAIGLGENFRILVETVTPTVYVAVTGMDKFDQNDSQKIDTFPTFGAATPLGIPSPPEISFSLSGFFDPVDPGQVRLRAQARLRVAVKLKLLHNGVDGYTQDALVGSRTYGAAATGGPQTQTFEFSPTADPVIVAAGPLP